jgi:hypothetical protein
MLSSNKTVFLILLISQRSFATAKSLLLFEHAQNKCFLMLSCVHASEEDFTLVVSINEYILRGDDVGTDRIHTFERGIMRVYAHFHATMCVRGVST